MYCASTECFIAARRIVMHLSLCMNSMTNCLLVFCSYCNTFASVIATAMSAEVQALEALKNESLLHCKVAQQIEELSERHLREYDALRQEQYERLTKVTKLFTSI
jgi:hypothetical protein